LLQIAGVFAAAVPQRFGAMCACFRKLAMDPAARCNALARAKIGDGKSGKLLDRIYPPVTLPANGRSAFRCYRRRPASEACNPFWARAATQACWPAHAPGTVS